MGSASNYSDIMNEFFITGFILCMQYACLPVLVLAVSIRFMLNVFPQVPRIKKQ